MGFMGASCGLIRSPGSFPEKFFAEFFSLKLVEPLSTNVNVNDGHVDLSALDARCHEIVSRI